MEGNLLDVKAIAKPLVNTLASDRKKDTHLRVTEKEAMASALSKR